MRAAHKHATERVGGASLPSEARESRRLRGSAFGRRLEAGLQRLDRQVQAADPLHSDLLAGKVDDFHEIAVQLKSAELSFRCAMEIRNKLVDAYREIMRMSD